MISIEDVREYLPTFLSQGSQTAFLEEIKHFLAAESKPFYTSALLNAPMLFQGDGLQNVLLINLPAPNIGRGRAMLLSNTCDVYPGNNRMFPASLSYAPIFSLPLYTNALKAEYPAERVRSHEEEI